ncbi:hypothetical protein BH10PLA1_BH10PLA1_03400 [soil metagenome]
MSSDLAVCARNIGKMYRIAHNVERTTTMAEAVVQKIRHPFRRTTNETFWALNDVSFDIRKGEVVGIIGRNGAGKSTLLKILSRITEPTRGEINLYGRVGSLLEVGTGFHQELTGRENIFLNGAILGMRRAEIRRQFDAIVDFSGVEKFLDTPVKRYSSGMYVRLAFAVAAHLQSEILIIDEVLAVGDYEFQRKCLGKMEEVAHMGRTVLFVSHNLSALSNLCNRGVVLKKGNVSFTGGIEEAVPFYLGQEEEDAALGRYEKRKLSPHPDELSITHAVVKSNGTYSAGGYPTGAPLEFTIELNNLEPVSSASLGIGISDAQGNRLTTLHSKLARDIDLSHLPAGQGSLQCVVKDLHLAPGIYNVKMALEGSNRRPCILDPAFTFLVTENEEYNVGGNRFAGSILCRQQWIQSEFKS